MRNCTSAQAGVILELFKIVDEVIRWSDSWTAGSTDGGEREDEGPFAFVAVPIVGGGCGGADVVLVGRGGVEGC